MHIFHFTNLARIFHEDHVLEGKCHDESEAWPEMKGTIMNGALHFTAPDLFMRAGCAPLPAKHGGRHAFCSHSRPGLACPAPSIRDLMKNPG